MPVGIMAVGLGTDYVVLDGDPAHPPTKKIGDTAPKFRPMSVVAKRLDESSQGTSRYGGRPRSRPRCVRWGPSSPHLNGAQPPLFGPCLLWPNGWMDHDATWYEGYPQAEQHCVICGPSSNPKGHSCPFSARVCCGQTAGWIKMPLGMKVGLGQGHSVLHGDPAPRKRVTSSTPHFRSMSIVAERSPTVEHL